MGQPPNWTAPSKFLDQNVKDFCENGYIDDSFNHCAHFVAHALGLSVGYTCKKQTGGQHAGASIRVHELFSNCLEVGPWTDKQAVLLNCLVFITHPGNVHLKTKMMDNHPRKHVGVFSNGAVIHYSNRKDRVVQVTIDEFKHHYEPPFNGLFFGTLASW